MQDRLTRITGVNTDKCNPKKCHQECKKSCPVVKAGGDALSMSQHPAWFSRDICSDSTGAPDLASVCGTSSAQRQNMDCFPSERLSRVASHENLASSDPDNLAVHDEQQNLQIKEAATHITSTSHGNYGGNVYMMRRKTKGAGVVSEACVTIYRGCWDEINWYRARAVLGVSLYHRSCLEAWQHSSIGTRKVEGEIRETVERLKLHQEELESAMWLKEEKDLEIERLRASLDV